MYNRENKTIFLKNCVLIFFFKTLFFIILTSTQISCVEVIDMNDRSYNKLTDEEIEIIINKGTEEPFSGEYNNFFEEGYYICKRCNAKLYSSTDKFASTCGWPSFDDEIEGAIIRQEDADGIRIEILCANCGGHLGHVFNGEGLTDKNTRHCVNSVSMIFISNDNLATAYFAGGCFWGVEYLFEHKDGVISAISGYMGGSLENPTYRDVSSGETGHLEVVKVEYNRVEVEYRELVKFFFEIHDPTQEMGQGPDIGGQYLSVVFYENNNEKEIVHELIDILINKGYNIATKVLPVDTFWKAEQYHQDYYDKNGQHPYCHVYQKKF